MKRLMLTMLNFYFVERVIKFLFVFAGLLILASLFLPYDGMVKLIILPLVLITLLPMLVFGFQLNTMLSNKHLSLIPHWRQTLLLATLSLIILLCALLTLAVSVLPNKTSTKPFVLFLWLFDLSSLLTLALQYVSRFQTRLLKVWFMVVFILVIWGDKIKAIINQLDATDPHRLLYGLTAITIISWLWMAAWLKTTRNIHQSFSKTIEAPSPVSIFVERIKRKVVGHEKTNEMESLLRATDFGNKTRIFAYTLNYFFWPLLAILYLSFTSKFLQSIPSLLLVLESFAAFVMIIQTVEWIPRLRFVWLKIAGNRTQFWQTWNKLLIKEILIHIALLSIYGVALSQFFPITRYTLTMYGCFILFVLPASCYLLAMGRILQNTFINIALFILFISSTLAIIFVANIENLQWVLYGSAFYMLLGLLSYAVIKTKLNSVDWLLLKPLTMSR